MPSYKLTALGRFVRAHGSVTSHDVWVNLIKDVERVADEDGEWELVLQERIDGMTKMLQVFRAHGVGAMAFDFEPSYSSQSVDARPSTDGQEGSA